MKYRTALELAQEAFKSGDLSDIEAATDAIKEALAQPEQDAELKLIHKADIDFAKKRAVEAQPEQNQFNPDWDAMSVMVEEQQRMAKRIAELEAQPEQEPVACASLCVECTRRGNWACAKATPPQRKPLTDDEIVKMDKWLFDQPFWRVLMLVRAIEAAHGIKGEA